MKTLKAILISSLLPAIVFLTACEKKGGGGGAAPTESPSSTVSADYPKFVRTWIAANGLEQSDEANSITHNPKTRELIEERFKGMEWSNDQAKASFSIELDAGRSLKFRSESGASQDQQGFTAIWTRPGPMIGGATSAIVKRSRPIPSAENALELLHTYVTRDGDIQSVVEWDE
jgi:hypothetical protein